MVTEEDWRPAAFSTLPLSALTPCSVANKLGHEKEPSSRANIPSNEPHKSTPIRDRLLPRPEIKTLRSQATNEKTEKKDHLLSSLLL